MAAVIPDVPTWPVCFRMIVLNNRVAIAIPDTGLLDEPTTPTIRAETVAKKKPNTIIITADNGPIGIAGIRHSITAIRAIPIIAYLRGISLAVRSFPPACPKPLIAFLKVEMISGKDFTRLMIPPAARAPAPIYLM
jgi:hypothetical protein